MGKKENYCGQVECPISGFCKRYSLDQRGLTRVDGLFANKWCDDFMGDEEAIKRAKVYLDCLPKEEDAKKSSDTLIVEKREETKEVLKKQREKTKKIRISESHPKPNMEDRIVPIDLTIDELIEKGQIAGDLNSKILKLEAEKKAFNDKIGSEIKIMANQLNDVLKEIEDKKEMRNMECTVSYDLDNKKVAYFNNGKRVDERPLTEDDEQQSLI